MPSRDQEASPLKLATCRTNDFTHFRTFGCRVWVRPPGQRTAKFRTKFEALLLYRLMTSLFSLLRMLVCNDLFSPDDTDLHDPHAPAVTIALLRVVNAILYADSMPAEDTQEVPLYFIHLALFAIASQALTHAERALGRFTRRRLKPLSTWPIWHAGEFKQLDRFHDINMFGTPIPCPPNAIVLRSHWRYGIKDDGTRRP